MPTLKILTFAFFSAGGVLWQRESYQIARDWLAASRTDARL